MKILVIISSTREGRRSDRLAKWVMAGTEQFKEAGFELVDLRDFDLPMFDEPLSPRYNDDRRPNPAAQKWLDRLAGADGYVIVTPEYNHSVPGSLKNALDYVAWETAKKPIAIVSHGTVGGARAAEHLKGIITEIQAVPMAVNVALTHRVKEVISEEGELEEHLRDKPEGPESGLKHMLDELLWYTKALAAARAK